MNNSKTNDQVSQYSNGRRFQTVPNTHEDTRCFCSSRLRLRLYFDPTANGNPFGYTDSRVRDPSDGYEVDNTSYISSHHYSSFPVSGSHSLAFRMLISQEVTKTTVDLTFLEMILFFHLYRHTIVLQIL